MWTNTEAYQCTPELSPLPTCPSQAQLHWNALLSQARLLSIDGVRRDGPSSTVSFILYLTMGRRLTRYRLMNCSIEGTSSPTSLSMVLYCDSNRVHAGEYLFTGVAQSFPYTPGQRCTHSAAVTESRTYARSKYSRATMMPKRVAKRPYFSLSAFVEYSLTSSSRLREDDMAAVTNIRRAPTRLGVLAESNLDSDVPRRSNLITGDEPLKDPGKGSGWAVTVILIANDTLTVLVGKPQTKTEGTSKSVSIEVLSSRIMFPQKRIRMNLSDIDMHNLYNSIYNTQITKKFR